MQHLEVGAAQPIFDLKEQLQGFVDSYGAMVMDAAPIVLGAALAVVGAVKGISLVKKMGNKVG